MDLSKIDLSALTKDEKEKYESFLEGIDEILDRVTVLPRAEAKGFMVSLFAELQGSLQDGAVEEARKWLQDQQNIATAENIICAACGETYPASAIKSHWRTCPVHPAGIIVRGLYEYADFMERFEAFCEDWGTLGTHYEYPAVWALVEKHLPEIYAECPPLTEEQMDTYTQEERDSGYARASYWGFTEFESGGNDGHFYELVEKFSTQKRRIALAKARGEGAATDAGA